jgi:hypothetical protein
MILCWLVVVNVIRWESPCPVPSLDDFALVVVNVIHSMDLDEKKDPEC